MLTMPHHHYHHQAMPTGIANTKGVNRSNKPDKSPIKIAAGAATATASNVSDKSPATKQKSPGTVTSGKKASESGKKPRVYNRITPTIKAIFDKHKTPEKQKSRSSLVLDANSNHSAMDAFDSFDLTCVKSVDQSSTSSSTEARGVISLHTDDELSLDDIIMKEINLAKPGEEKRRSKSTMKRGVDCMMGDDDDDDKDEKEDENGRKNDETKLAASKKSKESGEKTGSATMTLRNRAPSGFGNRNWF